jgi:C-glycoside oxidase
MFDGGSVIGSIPGQHLHDTTEPGLWERYNPKASAGIQSFYRGVDVTTEIGGTLAGVEPGMYNLAAFGHDTRQMSSNALAWNAGGMGIHWAAATPTPWGREVPDFIDPTEWSTDLDTASRLLRVHPAPRETTSVGAAVLRALNEVFADETAEGRHVQPMPLAIQPMPDGRLLRTGPNRIFEPIGSNDDPLFELRTGTQVMELLHDDGRTTGAVVRSNLTGARDVVEAAVTVVCADAVRTPQVLFASGIRPLALGCYLNEHAFLTGRVLDDLEKLGCSVDDVPPPQHGELTAGTYWLPHNDGAQPFHGQIVDVVYRDEAGGYLAYSTILALYVPTDVRRENRLEFSGTAVDAAGMPRVTVHFEYTDKDRDLIERARKTQQRAAERLGAACTRLLVARHGNGADGPGR